MEKKMDQTYENDVTGKGMRARTQSERDARGCLCRRCTGCFRCSFRKKQIEEANARKLEAPKGGSPFG